MTAALVRASGCRGTTRVPLGERDLSSTYSALVPGRERDRQAGRQAGRKDRQTRVVTCSAGSGLVGHLSWNPGGRCCLNFHSYSPIRSILLIFNPVFLACAKLQRANCQGKTRPDLPPRSCLDASIIVDSDTFLVEQGCFAPCVARPPPLVGAGRSAGLLGWGHHRGGEERRDENRRTTCEGGMSFRAARRP